MPGTAPQSFIFGLSLVLLCSLVFATPLPPAWWNDPIKEYSGNHFFTATGESATSADDALQDAQKAAQQHIFDRVAGGAAEVDAYLFPRIRGWILHTHHEANEGRNNYVWSILKYPKEEFQVLRDHAQGGPARFQEAVLAFAKKKKTTEALSKAVALSVEYPIGKLPIFTTELALLLLVDCHVHRNR